LSPFARHSCGSLRNLVLLCGHHYTLPPAPAPPPASELEVESEEAEPQPAGVMSGSDFLKAD
jgi:hypothetical protein